MSRPRPGDIVHYVSYGTPGGEYTSQCRAAIITENAGDHDAGLAVLNPSGLFFNTPIRHDEDQAPGTWHYVCADKGADAEPLT